MQTRKVIKKQPEAKLLERLLCKILFAKEQHGASSLFVCIIKSKAYEGA